MGTEMQQSFHVYIAETENSLEFTTVNVQNLYPAIYAEHIDEALLWKCFQCVTIHLYTSKT